ncbi:putative exonuclease domain-containing protein [Iris pallida]|uniref:Exonuclease domain-containing protein n=1 Tax=Iris pallida TaxID=29817 RepID=A0AAX6DW53_IRIPA|nr:putative exonuclease domain-containing protein [Iris pallida]
MMCWSSSFLIRICSAPTRCCSPLFPLSSFSSSVSLSVSTTTATTSSSSRPRNTPRVAMEVAGGEVDDSHPPPPSLKAAKRRGWKPMCLYYTQGKCTMMDDALHLDKFNHNYKTDLQVEASKLNKLKPKKFDYVLVLDLEGKVEILEFPVVMIDTKTMEFVDAFHRFVRPIEMSEQRVNEYIEGKYGKLGIDRVWHDTSIPFTDVLEEFELWLENHRLWKKKLGGSLDRAAFVTCGNWDLKTKVPQQCKVSKIKTPSYLWSGSILRTFT